MLTIRIIPQPSPAGSLNTDRRRRQLSLKILQWPKATFNAMRQFAAWLSACWWKADQITFQLNVGREGQICGCSEEGEQKSTNRLDLNFARRSNDWCDRRHWSEAPQPSQWFPIRYLWKRLASTLRGLLKKVIDQINQKQKVTFVLSFGQLLFRNVQVVDVSDMMFGVMQLHDICRNVRFKGIVVVRQVRQRMFRTTSHHCRNSDCDQLKRVSMFRRDRFASNEPSGSGAESRSHGTQHLKLKLKGLKGSNGEMSKRTN
jgi:hypothetical protein